MIKKQYNEWPGPTGECYFHKFLDTTLSDKEASEKLKKYDAELGKSKNRCKMNVKWRDPQKYIMFMLRWS